MNRRFLYMVLSSCNRSSYTLHRINPARLFFPSDAPHRTEAPVEDARLPRPTVRFCPPDSENNTGVMDFMLLGGSKNKIVGADQMGRAVLYDDSLRGVCALPSLRAPKRRSVSLTVDDSLYVIEAIPDKDEQDRRSLEALMYHTEFMEEDWFWHALTPPPYVHAPGYGDDRSGMITAFTVVGGSHIWISTQSMGTYSLDTASGKWNKIGDWTLPFQGCAEYIPEYNLWIGFSDREDDQLCTSDLRAASTARRPVARNVLEACAFPKGAIESYLVHLGAHQFCLAKRFETTHRETCDELCCIYETTTDMSMIFTGVEVERCGRGLQMVMHKSYRYLINGSNTPYCVL